MNRSDNISNIAEALHEFSSKAPKIERTREVKVKTKEGGSYSFSYAPLDEIESKCRPILSEHGLFVIQLIEANASVETIIMHKSGEYISSSFSLQPQLNGKPQEIGSAITYARRYAYCAALGLVADEDDDANASQGNLVTSTTDKPWLNQNTPEWKKAVDYLSKDGNINEIEKKYRLSKVNREQLLTTSI